MNQADIFYRAFLDYRKQTVDDSKCKKLRTAVRTASSDLDRLEAIRSHCIIKDDWVDRIYEGLPFIEKAIREERQFIRQQGEVVPIEKAKRVSKSSVEHLARHSDMITHEPPEDEDLIPDEIYIVERLSDFAVYENRFLYMLLCYLRDFIDLRYSKIVELGNTYRANMAMDKVVKIDKRVIKYKVTFDEEAKRDPFGFDDGNSDGLMKKIEEERHIISSLLMTPLMKEVSKSPMLKPPITRTNALKMNNNFKNALALYDYIAAYLGDGYTIETTKKTYSPFTESMGDEISELVSLTSFLVYEYGKDIKKELKLSYEEEEERRRQEAEMLRRQKLRDLKRRVEETGQGLEEYVLLLEKYNKDLEADRAMLIEARAQIEFLEGSIREHLKKQSELRDEIDDLHEQVEEKRREMQELEERCEREKAELAEECRIKCEETEAKCAAEIEEITARCTAEVEEISAKCAAEVEELTASCDAKVAAIETEMNDKLITFATEMTEKLNCVEQKEQAATAECARLDKERTLLKAELHAQRELNGTIINEGDFTDRDRFSELEREYDAIRTLVEREWKKTKKKIRKRVLWKKQDDRSEPTELVDMMNNESSENKE